MGGNHREKETREKENQNMQSYEEQKRKVPWSQYYEKEKHNHKRRAMIRTLSLMRSRRSWA